MADQLVCGECLHDAKPDCINGKCGSCGFAALWSRAVRSKLVNMDKNSPDCGTVLDGTPACWLQEVRYEVLQSGGSTPSNGSRAGEKEALRSQRTGSVIELLDAFEAASVKFPAHRHLVVDAKAKALRLARYFWPGMLLSDYDWSESPY